MSGIAPAPFEFAQPRSVEEAVALLDEDNSACLAGGTDFVSLRAEGRIEPTLVVDLKTVDSLSELELGGGGASLGACVTMSELVASELPRSALTDGACLVGSVQTRSRATLGGNVCRASPAGDCLPALLALKAAIVARTPAGNHQFEAAGFFEGPGATALPQAGLVERIELGGVVGGGGSAYERLTYRAWMDLAVMGVAVSVRLEQGLCVDASVALGGLGPTPILVPEAAEALAGSGLEASAIDAAVEAAAAASQPIDDVRGSAAYRVDGIAALMPKVVATAAERGS